MRKDMKKELKAYFEQEYKAGDVSKAVQELRMHLLDYAGSEEALETWLRKRLDAGTVTVEEVREYMPLWDGYEEATAPSFVARYEAEKDGEYAL